MKIINKKVLLAAGLILSSMGVSAEESKKVDNFFADCGIGGAIFKNDIGGVLSNLIWDFGLTATTSGLSSPETCEGQDVAAATFIHQTYALITEDTVKGEGQHLSSLLDLYSCTGTARAAAVTDIRSGFATVAQADGFSATSDTQKSQTYFSVVKSSVSACKGA